MPNLYIPACSFFIASFLLVSFFSKETVNNKETKIFKGLIVSSFLDSFVMVLIIFIAYLRGKHFSIYILNRIDFLQYLMWAWLFFIYIYYISNNHKKNNKYQKVFKITAIINILLFFLVLLLPLHLYDENGVMFSYGSSVNVLYVACGIFVLSQKDFVLERANM